MNTLRRDSFLTPTSEAPLKHDPRNKRGDGSGVLNRSFCKRSGKTTPFLETTTARLTYRLGCSGGQYMCDSHTLHCQGFR